MKFLFFASLYLYSALFAYELLPFDELEIRIVNSIKTPTKGKVKGEELLRDLFNYFSYLDDIDTLIIEKKAKGLEMLLRVGTEGPKFFNLTCNIGILKKAYKWDDYDIFEFHDTIKDIRYEWEIVKKYFGQNLTIVNNTIQQE